MLSTHPWQSTYVLPVSSAHGRAFASAAATHAYTVRGLWWKSLRDNTSVLALNAALVLPTLTRIDEGLKAHLNDGSDMDMLAVVKQSSVTSLIAYGDRLARVAVQTGVASALLQLHHPYTDSMVYLWEVYPRMFQHYLGQLAGLLRIPRFLVTLFGAAPLLDEVACMTATTTRLSALAAFEDCVKRSVIVLAGDVVVDTARIAMDAQSTLPQRGVRVLYTAVARVTAMLSSASGAAAGRAVGGDKGEFWGEYVGLLCAPVLSARVAATAVQLQRQVRLARQRARKATTTMMSSSSLPARSASNSAAPASAAAAAKTTATTTAAAAGATSHSGHSGTAPSSRDTHTHHRTRPSSSSTTPAAAAVLSSEGRTHGSSGNTSRRTTDVTATPSSSAAATSTGSTMTVPTRSARVGDVPVVELSAA